LKSFGEDVGKSWFHFAAYTLPFLPSSSNMAAVDSWIFPSRRYRRKYQRKLVSDLLCSQFGTTNSRDPAWQTHPSDPISQLLNTYTTPVYHVLTEAEYDMGHRGFNGERIPYVDSYTIYVWTTDDVGAPIVMMYIQDGTYKSNIHLQGSYSLSSLTEEFAEICEGVLMYRTLH
jgi:hypothetical protein